MRRAYGAIVSAPTCAPPKGTLRSCGGMRAPAGFVLSVLAALLVASTSSEVSGGDRGPLNGPPLWGCESPALPAGAVHVVVASYDAEPEQWCVPRALVHHALHSALRAP
jgi:hypothetical protein